MNKSLEIEQFNENATKKADYYLKKPKNDRKSAENEPYFRFWARNQQKNRP